MRALLIPALIALASSAAALTPRLFSEFTVQGGAAATVPDTAVTVHLTQVEDQRCPAGADCYWAGMIRVELTVTTPTSREEITLCNQCDGARDLATAAGMTFGLIGLAPTTEELAALGRPAQLSDYTLTLNYAPVD